MARRIVSARRLTKRSRSADRVDDGSLHSFVSGAGTGAGHDARRGRGGAAGGPSSISGAVWGAKDARRLGGGLSGCSAATGCCPFAAPSAPLVVGAASSMSRLQSLSVQRFGDRFGRLHTSSLVIGGRRAHRSDSPPFMHTGRETSGYTSIIDGAGLNQSNRVQRAAPPGPRGRCAQPGQPEPRSEAAGGTARKRPSGRALPDQV